MILASLLTQTAKFFIDGGFFMILLVMLSVVSLTVILLRARALRESVVLPSGVRAALEKLEPGDDLAALDAAMYASPSAISRVLATLIRHLDWPKSENRDAVQTRARHEVARMERGLVILEIATGVAPMLGLLGTLSGLVGIFAALGGSADPVAVARGIAEALNTTIVGMAVAVPNLTAHNYFQRKIEVMAVEMESLVSNLLTKCYPQGENPLLPP